MTARFIVGDVFDVLATLPDDSVDLVFSSPPFLALRSYLPADHPDKGKEIGSEATPADFLDTLLDVVEACDRVLAPHGSLCFELGDTFAGSGGAGGDYNEGGLRDGQSAFDGSAARTRSIGGTERAASGLSQSELWGESKHPRVHDPSKGPPIQNMDYKHRARIAGDGWPLDKSLCGIPTLFAWSLAYGRNLLRPERETPRWRIRNLIVWARPNPPVGALGDKFRPATSYLTVATKSRTRYFDLDAVREPGSSYDRSTAGASNGSRKNIEIDRWHAETMPLVTNPAGAPPLDYWVLPTAPYKGSHYATFPPELVVKPVKAMCPLRVCRVCGEPSRRITEVDYEAHGERHDEAKGGSRGRDLATVTLREQNAQAMEHGRATKLVETLGWTDCGHDDWRTGTVLDPFAGSGTTLSVATGHGRDAIGIDLDSRNADLALERVGPMLLTVEHLNQEPAA